MRPRARRANGQRPRRSGRTSVAADVPPEGEQHERDDEQEADADCEQQRPAVLLEGGSVPLDPVDPVQRALDLAERRRRGDHGPDEAEDEREVALLRAHLPRLLDRVGEDLARQPRHRVLDRVDDRPADLEVAERGREADQRDEPLDEDEVDRVRERAGVTEAVRVAKPLVCVDDQPRAPRLRSVSRASSPVSSHVSGTRVAVLMPHRDADLDRARLRLDLERLRSPRDRRRPSRRAPCGRASPRCCARVTWTNGDFALVPTAVRAIVRAHST